MSETVKIRIGLQSARELELDVPDGDAVVEELDGATEWIVWVEDAKGRRHGVVVDKIAFVEVDSRPAGPGVGFSS